MSKPRYELSSGVLGVIGFFLGCASVWVAGRWGFTPFLLGIAGMLGMPAASAAMKIRYSRVPGGWIGQTVIIAVVVLMLAGVARWSAHITPEKAFISAFGVPIPAAITDVEAEQQYYDGYIVALSFHANAQQLQTILSAQPFVSGGPIFEDFLRGKRLWSDFWRLSARPWVDIVHPGWPIPPPTQATNYYCCIRRPNHNDFVKVFWDASSGQAYVLSVSD